MIVFSDILIYKKMIIIHVKRMQKRFYVYKTYGYVFMITFVFAGDSLEIQIDEIFPFLIKCELAINK